MERPSRSNIPERALRSDKALAVAAKLNVEPLLDKIIDVDQRRTARQAFGNLFSALENNLSDSPTK